jgi:hypothetical protein
MSEYPQPGQVWKHYKGGQYEIVAMCNHTDTDEILVIYKSLSFGGFHARPYYEWHEVIGDEGLVGDEGFKEFFRFEKIK